MSENATIAQRHDFTESMVHLGLDLDAPLAAFKPGQYVSLGVPAGEKLVQRPYSIVSWDEPTSRLELFIRRAPDGALTTRLWELGVGARVKVGQPKGLFVLDQEDRRQRLLIGTGTGLAPLLAMLDLAYNLDDDVPTVLIHGVAYQDEAVYRNRVTAWQEAGLPVDYLPSVSRPDDPRNHGWTGLSGRADVVLRRVLDEWPETRHGVAYMCGNPDMIESCTSVLAAAGFAAADIRSEQFKPQLRA